MVAKELGLSRKIDSHLTALPGTRKDENIQQTQTRKCADLI
jgi:hypothetical protein